MPFPAPSELKHLPLSPMQEDDLINFLAVELDRAEADRRAYVEKLKEEIRLYEAVPVDAAKTWPWPDASNLVVPIIGSMVDTIFPRIYSTLFGVTPVITFEEKDPDFSDNVKEFQFYFDIIQKEELKLQRTSQDWFLESIIHGTSVVKLVWDKHTRTVKGYNEKGEITKQKEKVVKNGPALYRVPLVDFFIPFYASSIADAPWVAQRFRTYWGRLKAFEDQGIYKNLDLIQYTTEFESDEYTQKREEIEETEPSYQEEYELFEFWLEYDIDNDGADENLIVTYHADSRTILRVQFNPYWHMRKPFREFIYWPRHDRFYGIGIATMIAPIQDEVTSIHNQNLDNRTIANTRMWEVVKGSTADRNFSGVAPGRVVRVDRLGEEIQSLEMGEVYASSVEAEQIPMRLAQQRSGVSDFLSGMDFGQGAGRETATTTMVRMQEARTRFNWTMDSARMALQDIAEMTVTLLQQFAEEDTVARVVGDDGAILVQELLELDEEEVRGKVGMFATASSASVNKEAEKQNLIGLSQLLQQQTLTYEMPLVQIVLNPQAPPPLKEWAMNKLNGSRVLFDRILQTFDERNAEEILGSLRALEQTLEPAGPPLGAPLPTPTGGAQGAFGVTGVGGPGPAVG